MNRLGKLAGRFSKAGEEIDARVTTDFFSKLKLPALYKAKCFKV